MSAAASGPSAFEQRCRSLFLFPNIAWERLLGYLAPLAAVVLLSLSGALVAMLVYQAWPVIRNGHLGEILSSTNWDPDRGAFGALLFVYGSGVSATIALAVALPLGVGAAVYLSEIARPQVRRWCAFFLELLAAIPSVVFGFWALEVLARRVLGPVYVWGGWPNPSGEGLLAAAGVLAIMILPYITALSYDACRSVPVALREGALALGATRWQMIRSVVLPVARPAILAAALLALGRAIGETMAVTMVVGNAQHFDFSPIVAGDTIPSLIAKQLHETTPQEPRRAVLMALGLLLLVLAGLMNAAGRLVVRWSVRPARRLQLNPLRPSTSPQSHLGQPAALPATAWLAYASQGWDRRLRYNRWVERLMTAVLTACQWLTLAPLFAILGYISWQGAGQISWSFFTHVPHDNPPGLAHALYGSFLMVLLASLVAVPLGILVAIFLYEHPRHWLHQPLCRCCEWLASVPSILIGVFGYLLLVSPPGSSRPWGYSALAGAFALAVMMLPVVSRSAYEALQSLPDAWREAAWALGATPAQTLRAVLLPAAWPAILTGILLAAGRIFGETAPLILTARGSHFFPRSLTEPTPSLPFYIYDFAQKPDDTLQRLAWAGAFVLALIVLCINTTARLLTRSRYPQR
jgi:phosphate transport system permease protein